MGKDLKGKELGVGISQRKDGLYTARFTDVEVGLQMHSFKINIEESMQPVI